MGKPKNCSARIPKAILYPIVEQSYSEGIGARRLSEMIGYSARQICIVARLLELPRLPRYVPYSVPSVKLLGMIGAVAHLRIAPPKKTCVNNAGTVRPQESEAA